MEISEKIHRLREAKKLSQTELANLIFRKQPLISAYESGKAKPPKATAYRLAEVLEVPCEYLLDDA